MEISWKYFIDGILNEFHSWKAPAGSHSPVTRDCPFFVLIS